MHIHCVLWSTVQTQRGAARETMRERKRRLRVSQVRGSIAALILEKAERGLKVAPRHAGDSPLTAISPDERARNVTRVQVSEK